jgi:hypothetical protein
LFNFQASGLLDNAQILTATPILNCTEVNFNGMIAIEMSVEINVSLNFYIVVYKCRFDLYFVLNVELNFFKKEMVSTIFVVIL